MAVVANTKTTFGNTNIVEDVTELIEILSPQENYFYNNLRKTNAVARVHQTQTDTLATPTVNALNVDEGNDASYQALTTPTRVTNVTEIIQYAYMVSGSQRAVEQYAGGDELSRQREKAMKNWSNQAEFDIVRSTLTSGASGTVQDMKGIITQISTNLTAQTSGTVFSETILDGLLNLTYTNGNGELPDTIAVGAWLKRKIDGFTTNVTRNVNASEYKQIKLVDTYISSFGTQKVILHRYVFVSGTDATSRVLGVQEEKWAIAFLRKPFREPLAKTGDSDKEHIVGELTVECDNEKTNFVGTGYNLTL